MKRYCFDLYDFFNNKISIVNQRADTNYETMADSLKELTIHVKLITLFAKISEFV